MSETPPNDGDQFQVTLETCDQEPIHIPGAVQPHGLLLALSEPDLTVAQLSDNAAAFLGRPLEETLGAPVAELLAEDSFEELRRRSRATPKERALAPLRMRLKPPGEATFFDGIVHRSGELLILELEPQPKDEPFSFENLYAMVAGPTGQLQNAQTVTELREKTAAIFKQLTGFDRVMVYQFDRDWHGEVVSEAKEDRLEPFLGLHYPASDIPLQARRLYVLNRIRLIADVMAEPARLRPERNPLTGDPLDLSHAVLRAVSPIHIEYLQNMGVDASMSISLVKQDELWGLIACHGYSGPHYVSYEVRQACEFLGQTVSLLLPDLLIKEEYEDRLQKDRIHDALADRVEKLGAIGPDLLNGEPGLMDLVEADGVALVYGGAVRTTGRTPSQTQIRALVDWLIQSETFEHSKVWETNHLSGAFPEAEAYADAASGLLAMVIARTRGDCVLWFRGEVVQTVSWAGDPSKSVQVDPVKERLSPRKSFQKWKEVVNRHATRWSDAEIDAVKRLRVTMVETERKRAEAELKRSHEQIEQKVADRTAELERVNAELKSEVAERKRAEDELENSLRQLEVKNAELERFTYTVSHDLKSPLITIVGFLGMLEKDALAGDESRIREDIERIGNAADRMRDLLDELLKLSRVGRLDNPKESIDMPALAKEAAELVSGRLARLDANVEVDESMPAAWGDKPRLREVFQNLLDNAAKFMPQGREPRIRVYCRDASPGEPEGPVYCVEDNGMGVDARHHDKIFNIFDKLDADSEGTGVGLAMVKRIIEDLHGGAIWVLSEGADKGAAFCFTLAPAPRGVDATSEE